ncbi:MAG: HAMP domain-containing histidine kinase [Bacteroidales bacterium]|nr:HAMP domain-containing histidine kinase [Bacteroidales bacterium]
MKLSTKNNINFLISSLFIFFIALTAIYFLLVNEINKNISKEMEKRKTVLLNHISNSVTDPTSSNLPESKDIEVRILSQNELKKYPLGYSDTLKYDHLEKKYIPVRRLTFVTTVNNKQYGFQITRSLEQSDHLIISVLLMITMVTIMVVVGMFFLNQHISRKAWKGFYDTLRKIYHFKVNSFDEFSPIPTEIKEFEDLNNTIISLTNRIKEDYFNLKEYSENVSHELQTPLAIINSKMELLLQYPDYCDEQLEIISEVFNASIRLSKLNKSLMLLTKIENKQFAEPETISLAKTIEQKINEFDDLIQSKEIELIKKVNKDFYFKIDPYFAGILFANLIKNSIRYNFRGGKIVICVDEGKFSISNSGKEKIKNPELIFKRFYKNSESKNSLGLGLSIVKKICDSYGFRIKYSFADKMHTFTVTFPLTP